MNDEIQKLQRSIISKKTVIFVGHEVAAYTNNHARGVSLYQSEQNTNDSITSAPKRQGKFSVQVPDLIQALGELRCPLITTNYDLLLEDILGARPVSWQRFCAQEGSNLDEDQEENILHLYGHIDEPQTMVVKPNDHARLRSDVHGQAKLQTLLEDKVLLFIGYRSEMEDWHFSTLVTWIGAAMHGKMYSIYKLTHLNSKAHFFHTLDADIVQRIREIPYGRSMSDLVGFIEKLKLMTLVHQNINMGPRFEMREKIRRKYMQYLIHEYGYVAIFGYSNHDINLPLQSVFVELKFDPTHPSIKAMKAIEIHEEFKRKLLAPGFFTSRESLQLNRAILERNAHSTESISRDFMLDQWVNVLLSNRTIFTENEATTIKAKIDRLKQSILKQNNLQEAKQYRIQQAYNEFKHFVVLGHPGSGKTTLSKWLVTNMAKQHFGEENVLFEGQTDGETKVPVLIPIWKYVDQLKDNRSGQKQSLLQFICQNPTFNAAAFTDVEQFELSSWMMDSLLQGNVLIVLEGLDEVPNHVDRADLMREINALLERRIEYDSMNDKLVYSTYEQKEINSTKDSTIGNRCIITSRIEGNYFEDINFYIPRLTIENMSADALQSFCSSYMKCIRDVSSTSGETAQTDQGDQLYRDIVQNKDIFQLAINPQLASVIAAIYYQYGDKLPENRIDLYEKAIAMMIDRVVSLFLEGVQDDFADEFHFDRIRLWTIWQEIAEYLHNRVEGLSEDVLKEIIKRCLVRSQQDVRTESSTDIDHFISQLVDIFKYQAGLLNEFGQNSFRFIHRTFQEYLAAKCIIYVDDVTRTEDAIYERIREKMAIPNWRVPLSMAFGILSRSSENETLFSHIIARLLNDGRTALETQCSTQLVPFVIIDSLHDMHFPSTDAEHDLVQKLADMLLLDYKNLSGFSRLKDHQGLIHSYFMKLKTNHVTTLVRWFVVKISDEENLAPCANILLQLKWYSPVFHETFLQNLHYDSPEWNWSIDGLLRFYAAEIRDLTTDNQLIFRARLRQSSWLVRHIVEDPNWLCLIVALYGGYTNYRISASIKEYHETSQFLNLTDTERTPFLFYYQEVWGREDPAYQMAVHLDTKLPTDLWKTKPIFDRNNIHREASLTETICKYLEEGRSTDELLEDFIKQLNDQTLTMREKIDVYMALTVSGRFDLVATKLEDENRILIQNFQTRIEQVLHNSQDPIARFSCQLEDYLLAVYNKMKYDRSVDHISFSDYCKIHLSIASQSGALPVDTKSLATAVTDLNDKHYLLAEYVGTQFTGASEDLRYRITVFLDDCLDSNENGRIVQTFLKIADAVQLYKPVRAYPWPIDRFVFKFDYRNDLPIAFFNCLEALNPNIGFSVQAITEVFLNEGYYHEEPELIPLVVLLNFGIMSKDVELQRLCESLLPELEDQSQIKEFLLIKIQAMCNPYYKCRGLYQLAQFSDEKCHELLHESFELVEFIAEPILKFQVLEKIFNVVHYKDAENATFIEQITDQLVATANNILDSYNRIIASVRLSFYGSAEWRKKYLADTIDLLSNVENSHEKMQLILKLKPLINLYDDLRTALEAIVEGLVEENQRHLINGYYGKILSKMDPVAHGSDNDEEISQISEDDDDELGGESMAHYTELRSVFLLFARLTDMKLTIDQTDNTDQLWKNLLVEPDNITNVKELIKYGLDSEIFLTPEVAIVIDELVEKGHDETVAMLLPYIIRPSHEVIPIVQKWFTRSDHPSIQRFATLLLAETRYIFAAAVDTLIDLLKSNNDQLRYRTQRIFQHPERDVQQPSKRISVIGEKTISKLLQTKRARQCLPRVRIYLSTYFFDLLWDDPEVFSNLRKIENELRTNGTDDSARILAFNKINFTNQTVWRSIYQSAVASTSPRYLEDILQAAMMLTQRDQITPQNWTELSRTLATADLTQFQEKVYATQIDINIITLILNEICALTDLMDETYFEVLESKVTSTVAITVQDLVNMDYIQIKEIGRCNFYLSRNLTEEVLALISNAPTNITVMENLIKWLAHKLSNLDVTSDAWFSILMVDAMLFLVSAFVQQEDYLYRKITNSPDFDKANWIKALDHTIQHNPCFPSRGNAFILLAALDHSDLTVIIHALNTLFDENLVKEYAIIGLPLIHLAPDELIDELLFSINDDSAVKAYEILKIFTQYTLDEKIDANSKSKIIAYLAKEIEQLESKRPVNYYYTDIKIPFTTTLENELYKAWIKIQGLSGKAQYSASSTQ